MERIKKFFVKLLNLSDPQSKKIIMFIIISKLLILTIIVFAYKFFDFKTFNYYDNFLANPEKQVSIVDAFSTWDAQHYIFLSEKGYQKTTTKENGEVINNHLSNAFYPLYPYSIKLTNVIFQNPVLSGYMISNIASFLAFIYFYKFVKENFNEKTAIWSLVFLLAFPTSFYFTIMYTESVFFLFTILFFIFLFRNNYKLAALSALLLPLIRPNGILIIVPFIFYFLFNKYKVHKFDLTKYFDTKIIYLISPLVGMFIYFLIMQTVLGDFRMGYRAQSFYLADNSISNILNPLHWFATNFIYVKWTWHDYQNSAMDRVFLLIYLLLLLPIAKFKQKTLFVFALVFGMIPALSGTLSSFTRYLVVVFPIFIAIASIAKNTILKYALLITLISLQLLLLVMHSLNYWVA